MVSHSIRLKQESYTAIPNVNLLNLPINCQGKVLITDLSAIDFSSMKGGKPHIGSVTIRVLPEARPFYLVVLDIMGVEGYELLKPERKILVFVWTS